VHISELSNKFIKDPSEAVKAGQIVKVKVLSADARTKRVSLSIKALQENSGPRNQGKRPQGTGGAGASGGQAAAGKPSPARASSPPLPVTMEDKIAALTARWQKR